MCRRNIIIGLLALVVCGVLAVVFWPEKPEPVYKGKKLTDQVRLFYQEKFPLVPDFEKRMVEEEAILAIGTNAIPFYVEWLDYKPNMLTRAGYALAKMSNEWLPFKFPAEDIKLLRSWGAYWSLMELGETAEPAIPQLVRYATDRQNADLRTFSVAEKSIGILANIGRPAVPSILSLMTNGNPSVRALALKASWNAKDPSVVAKAKNMLADRDPEVRAMATNAAKAYEAASGFQVLER